MATTNNYTRKKRVLFNELNAMQLRYDSSIGSNIRCPLCWRLFNSDLLQTDLSLEHIPPTAAAKLIGETKITTLTCRNCNNNYGRKYQNDLKNFVRHQLLESGKFSGKISSEVTFPGTAPLKCNITWTPGNISIAGVPKANNPSMTEQLRLKLNELVATRSTDWGFHLKASLEYRLPNAWFAFLHTAYLLLYVRTQCHYPLSKAGQVLRELLAQHDVNKLGACVIIPQRIRIEGNHWMARIVEPKSLQCLWVKTAGNIVIMPLDNDVGLSCYKAWQEVSEQTQFGISPKKVHLKIDFPSEQDMLEAQKCLPSIG